ncbi:T-box transcription factor TBX5-like [Ruditapes philippinarum]|uniref:T-box transcription factor TBX5-like n=1 Tax=Ruditapes philippinarum TaxID=129788 RepID=UPI00295C1614|nr:T-box transcription factor TBX5-like [Ruditapes philippinarum]
MLHDVQSSNVSRSGDPIHVTQCPVQATFSAYHQGESETRSYHDVQYQSYFEDYHKERTNNCGAFISQHCSSNKSEQINERQSGAPYTFTESPSSTMCISQHFRSGTNSRSQLDNYCWKFKNGKWKPFDDIERKTRAGGIYLHPDSPSNGAFWMKENVVFNKLKLTNIARDVSGQIYLNSMHKYQPRVHVVEVGQNRAGDPDTLQTKVFQETQFIAVTSYQNVEITQLKIDNNPFATGFRDSKHGNETSNRNMPGCQHNETLFLEDNVLFPSINSSDDSFVSGAHMIKSENERTINECHDPTNGYSVSNPTYSPYYQSSSYSSAGVISSTNQHGDLQVAMTFNQLSTDQEGQFLMNMSDVMRKQPDDQMYGVEPTTKTNQVFWYDV